MIGYNSQVCNGENTYRIQYETNNKEYYLHIQEEIRKQIDIEDLKTIDNCCIDIDTLIALDERAQHDLLANTNTISREEIITIIREFIRLKNDYNKVKEE